MFRIRHATARARRGTAVGIAVTATLLSGCGLFNGDVEDAAADRSGSSESSTSTGGSDAPASPSPSPSWAPAAFADVAPGVTSVTGEDSFELSFAAAETFFQQAPVAVVTESPTPDEAELAAWLAVRLGAPLLLAPPAEAAPSPGVASPPAPTDDSTPAHDGATADSASLTREQAATGSASPTAPPSDGGPSGGASTGPVSATLADLDVRTVVTVGSTGVGGDVDDVRRVAVETDRSTPAGEGSRSASARERARPLPWWQRLGNLVVNAVPVDADLGDVRDLLRDAATAGNSASGDVVLVRPSGGAFAAAASAAAAGHRVLPFTGNDPRGDATLRTWLPDQRAETVVLLGRDGDFSGVDESDLTWQLAVARRGLELPGGGQLLLPDRRLVALYGNPETAALGVLGEQGPEASVRRARDLADAYAPYSDEPVIPAFEIIATVASAYATPEGDYSHPAPMDLLERWVDEAGRAGVYVLLDLQPGRTDFLTQAKMFEPLLRQPHVGLALDPEWRLEPDEVHLQQIGSVSIQEVNRVVAWLADLTRREALPQKMLLLHQFRLSMLPGRDRLDTPSELAIAIQMDGQGPQSVKLETWRAVTRSDPPDGVWFGWKNFYDEDTPTRSPADTMALDPKPFFVSYP